MIGAYCADIDKKIVHPLYSGLIFSESFIDYFIYFLSLSLIHYFI